jgi:hypothetical protein
VVVLGASDGINDVDLSVVRDFAGADVAVHLAAPDGTVLATART